MRESELAPPVVRHLAAQGYRAWVDPDGSDYFDLIARRERTIGLVELKVADWRKVMGQAVRRRAWADWVAVALPRRSLAGKALARPTAARTGRVGVWVVEAGEVTELRAAQPLREPGEPDPFAEERERMHLMLDLLESSALAPGVEWNLTATGRGGRGRSPRGWTLEEFEGPP